MNTMKMLCAVLAMLWGTTVIAQPKKERVEALRIAYISERLQLTPDEAKMFWPVYNKLETEMKELRKKYRIRDEEEDMETMSEDEAEKKLNELIAFKEAQLNLAKKYQSELKKVLPAKKVLLLYRAEEDFKRELLKRIRERRGAQGGQPVR